MELLKFKTLINQQKRAVQQATVEQQVYLLSEIRSSILKLVQIILVLIMLVVVLNEQILYKLVITF